MIVSPGFYNELLAWRDREEHAQRFFPRRWPAPYKPVEPKPCDISQDQIGAYFGIARTAGLEER